MPLQDHKPDRGRANAWAFRFRQRNGAAGQRLNDVPRYELSFSLRQLIQRGNKALVASAADALHPRRTIAMGVLDRRYGIQLHAVLSSVEKREACVHVLTAFDLNLGAIPDVKTFHEGRKIGSSNIPSWNSHRASNSTVS
jgi:hypothetical protein